MKTLKSEILAEAISIGNEIIAASIMKGKNGCSWATLTFEFDDERTMIPTWKETLSLYEGSSGIVLFLLRLFEFTKDKRYLETAIKGANYIVSSRPECSVQELDFYFGRTGIAKVLLEIYNFTKEKKYYNKAIQLATDGVAIKDGELSDLLNGYSGSLLGLLLLFSETHEKELLPTINLLAGKLIETSNLAKSTGIYWDRNKENITGLCGLSHGASGIGLAFLELGKFTQNASFYCLAEQAFLYEEGLFDKKSNNWPDLRGKLMEGSKYHYDKGRKDNNFDVFKTGLDFAAWCHGAPGIGLALIEASCTLRKKKYAVYAERALKRTAEQQDNFKSKDHFQSHILCHGINGNAILFLEAWRTTKKEEYLNLAMEAANMLIQYKRKFGCYSFRKEPNAEKNLSLFSGIAGVGYFYLRCLTPSKSDFVLSPKISLTPIRKKIKQIKLENYNFLAISKIDTFYKLFSKNFDRTLNVLNTFYKRKLAAYLNSLSKMEDPNLKKSFFRFVSSILKDEFSEQNQILKDAFELEKQLIEMDHNLKSFSLIDIQQQVARNEGLIFVSKRNWRSSLKRIKLAQETKIIITSDMPQLSGAKKEGGIKLNAKKYAILQASYKGTQEFYISKLSFILLKMFRKEITIGNAKKRYVETVGRKYEIKIGQIKIYFDQQVVEFLKSGVLVIYE